MWHGACFCLREINGVLNVSLSELLVDAEVVVEVVGCFEKLWKWVFNLSANVDNRRAGCGCPCSS